MDTKNRFYRAYPIIGVLLLLITTIAPALYAVAALPDLQAVQDNMLPLGYSAALALACTLLSLLLGLPGAHIMTAYRFPTRRLFKTIYAVAMLLPSTVVAIFPDVVLGLLRGFGIDPSLPFPWLAGAVVLAIFNIPVVITLVSIWWTRIEAGTEICASTLGMGGGSIFRNLTAPRLRPAILGSASLVFIRCFSSMEFTLGASGAIHSLAISGQRETAGFVALLNVLVLIVAACPMVLAARQSADIALRGERQRRGPSFVAGLLILLYLLVSFVVLVGPVAATVYASVRDGGLFSLSAYRDLPKPLLLSLAMALASALVATFMAKRLAMSFSGLALVSVAFSPAALGLGYSLLAVRLPMVDTIVFEILAHAAVSVPAAVLVILPFMESIPENLESISRTLGIRSALAFRLIDGKILGRAVFSAFLISFIISLGESGTSLFLEGRNLTVLLSGTARTDLRAACAMASSLILVCLVLFLIAARLLRSKEGVQSV